MNEAQLESSRQAEYQNHARQALDDAYEKGYRHVYCSPDGKMTFTKQPSSQTKDTFPIKDAKITFALAKLLSDNNIIAKNIDNLEKNKVILKLSFGS